MSEQTQNNQMLVMGLVVIAVLLAAIAGVIIYKQNTSLPPVTAPATSANTPATGASTGGTTGGATGQQTPAAPVDPKSATKVPNGTTPEAFVKAYYEECQKGDWQAAFDKLPAAKKQGNSPDALKEQVSGYGIKSASVTGAQTQGDKMQVTAEQVTSSYGTFVNTWTFEKKGGVWYAADKAVTGMK